MNNDNPSDPSFFQRVISNDSFKKGVGTAVAGLLVAAVVEAIWPSGPNADT